MSSNGCGVWGEFTKVWTLLSRSAPPFEVCCEEHDLAYDQVESVEDKIWADEHLRRCMAARGYPVLGIVFDLAVTTLGWFAILREKLCV